MSAGSQPGAIVGPLKALMSTCTVVTSMPLRRTWSARSLIRAAPLYQVSWPAGAADSVGSPPPLSTTTPGWPPAITRVVSRASRSSASSAAAVVSTLLVDAGCIGRSAPCAHSCAPVIASVILPVSAPRFGSATNGANVAASRSGVGLSAESATGTMPGFAVAAGGVGLMGCGVAGRIASR